MDKDATGCNEDVNKDVLVCNEEEEEMETGATNRPYYKKRVCRHMGLSESSPSCAICKLVRLFFMSIAKKYIYINNIFSNLLDDRTLNISK